MTLSHSQLMRHSSFRMTDQNDLPLKHQRLLAEYQRVRAQVVVLKKAVTDDQAASKELKIQVKDQDQSLRKLEQEIECLQFRNVQLTRRVSVLQEDLDQLQASKTKPVKGQTAPVSQSQFFSDMSVLNAELSCKIEENKELHMKLQTALLQNNQIIDELNGELSRVRCESGGKIQEQREMIEQQREEVNKLHQEKTRLENKGTSLEEQLNKASIVVQKFFGKSIDDMDDVVEGRDDDEVVVRHLKQRISDLIDGYHAADSKAVLFLAEANRLKQRLGIAAEEKKSMLDELTESKQLVRKLRDELSTSVRNYETQLVTMSDHLANESEKWSQQQLELDNLKEMTNPNHNRRFKK